jgi:pyruvate carboxylase
VLAIKDMAGLLRAPAAARLVSALKSQFDMPVHVHTHDTPGGQLATYLAAWQAGAHAVDGAAAPLAGTTSQPALSSIVAAAANTAYDTGLSLAAFCDLEPYWEALRKVYAPFESACPPRPDGYTTTRYPAANCRICGSRPSRWVSVTGSKTSKMHTPVPIPSSGTS